MIACRTGVIFLEVSGECEDECGAEVTHDG